MRFSDKLISEYQKSADHTLARVCRLVLIILILIGFLNYSGVFVIQGHWMYTVTAFSLLVALLPTVIFDVLKVHSAWARYLVLTAISIMCATMYAVLSYHAIIMLVFPLVCACLYRGRKWIVFTMAVMIPLIIVSHLAALWLKVVPDEPLVTLHGVIYFGIVPRLLQFITMGVLCIGISNKLKKMFRAIISKNNELYENQQMLITSLSNLMEVQSQETGLHVKRVSEYTRILCEGLGYDSEKTWMVSIASMMHDVGKILVPTEIIEKPGKLTPEEFETIKLHVDYGRKMLENSPGELMQISAEIADQHHEKWDGTGYKHRKGTEISQYARIVAIADVFDALVSWRTYKKPWTAEEAYNEIMSQSAKQFDPELVEIFHKNFESFTEVLHRYPENRKITAEELL